MTLKECAFILIVVPILSGCIDDDGATPPEAAGATDPWGRNENPGFTNRTDGSVPAMDLQLTNCTLIRTYIRTPRDTISAQGPDEWRSTTIDDRHVYYTFFCTRVGFNGVERGPLAFVLETISISGVPARCDGSSSGLPEFVYAIHSTDARLGNALSVAIGAPAYNSSISWGALANSGDLMNRLEIQPHGFEASQVDAIRPTLEPTSERSTSVSFFHTNETTTARLTLDAISRYIFLNDYRGVGQFSEPAMASQSPVATYPVSTSYDFEYNASGVLVHWDEPLCGS